MEALLVLHSWLSQATMAKQSLTPSQQVSQLELLISGQPDLKKHTKYNGYNVHSPQIQWLW
jgi:hypothetical protein